MGRFKAVIYVFNPWKEEKLYLLTYGTFHSILEIAIKVVFTETVAS